MEDLLVAFESIKAAFELFRVGPGSAKNGASFRNPDQSGLEFLQNTPQVVHYFLNLSWESR